MEILVISANPLLEKASGRAAVMRGPIVYCAEGHDNQEHPIRSIHISRQKAYEVFEGHVDGVKLPFIRTKGRCPAKIEALYSPEAPTMEETQVTLIPYFAWTNRGQAEMSVWLLEDH